MTTPVLDPVDDWSDVTNPSLRRVLQNRLSQRASRQRKLQREADAGHIRRRRGRPVAKPKPPHAQLELDSGTAAAAAAVVCIRASSSSRSGASSLHATISSSAAHISHRLGTDNDAVVAGLVRSFAAAVLSQLTSSDPCADSLLLPLTRLNTLRATLSNMYTLDITMSIMNDDSAESAFFSAASASASVSASSSAPSSSSSALTMLNLPPSLQPTPLQVSRRHHPWFDILPFPALRDVLIARQDEYDDLQLCMDMLGLGSDEAPVGLLVWQEPWDPHGWEMTEEFARKWLWLFSSSADLKGSTAYWRRQRGEAAMVELLDP